MPVASDYIQVGVDGMSKLTSVLTRIANALEILVIEKKKEKKAVPKTKKRSGDPYDTPGTWQYREKWETGA